MGEEGGEEGEGALGGETGKATAAITAAEAMEAKEPKEKSKRWRLFRRGKSTKEKQAAAAPNARGGGQGGGTWPGPKGNSLHSSRMGGAMFGDPTAVDAVRERGSCRHCGASLKGVARGAGRKLGTVPKGYCDAKCHKEYNASQGGGGDGGDGGGGGGMAWAEDAPPFMGDSDDGEGGAGGGAPGALLGRLCQGPGGANR